MGGSVKFEDALAARLNIMGLSRQKLDEFLQAHPAQLTPGQSMSGSGTLSAPCAAEVKVILMCCGCAVLKDTRDKNWTLNLGSGPRVCQQRISQLASIKSSFQRLAVAALQVYLSW